MNPPLIHPIITLIQTRPLIIFSPPPLPSFHKRRGSYTNRGWRNSDKVLAWCSHPNAPSQRSRGQGQRAERRFITRDCTVGFEFLNFCLRFFFSGGVGCIFVCIWYIYFFGWMLVLLKVSLVFFLCIYRTFFVWYWIPWKTKEDRTGFQNWVSGDRGLLVVSLTPSIWTIWDASLASAFAYSNVRLIP